MMYLEMSRDEAHGGRAWAFSKCIWAPTRKSNGGSWPFWTKILDVEAGDTVLHLRGIPPAAVFTGYSTASSDGYETENRPPEPGGWAYSESFYRADLDDYTLFHAPVNLTQIFSRRRHELEGYFDKNRDSGTEKRNIFFVRQSGRLQCLNGAYLSSIDDELFEALFGISSTSSSSLHHFLPIAVATFQQLVTVKSRIGQSEFAKQLKKLYSHQCCFPSCSVSDAHFLIASHIARWSDNEDLRGHFGNGLCFCLMHDKAFEIGLFTLNDKYEIHVGPIASDLSSPFINELRRMHGKQIRLSTVAPLKEALSQHWNRVKLFPGSGSF
jgi:putative restriction endonuclease